LELAMNLVTDGEAAVAAFLRMHGSWALLLVFLVAATQTGFVLGPLLPGTTILFICGVFARSEPQSLQVAPLGLSALAGGVSGAVLHYFLGRWAAEKLFVKDRGIWNRQNLRQTEAFFAKHGRASLLLAPSVPIVRTFASVVAGASSLPLPTFVTATAGGVLFWVTTAIGAGYLAGILPGAKVGVLAAAGLFSLLLGLRVAWKAYQERRKASSAPLSDQEAGSVQE
jgi:membrane-associated protein